MVDFNEQVVLLQSYGFTLMWNDFFLDAATNPK